MSINKVVYGGKTLIDLTGDTVTADKILKGFTSHGKDGDLLTGTCTYDVDSSDATGAVAEILKGKTAYVRGKKLTGTMPNNGAVTGTIATLDGDYVVPQGYHDGSGKVSIDTTEKAKLVAKNIREGITILKIPVTFLIACVVAIWIICNEIISILENMVDIGIQIPSFLLPLVKNIKSQTEHFAGSDQKESEDK